jgi:4-carboxymuconolactone decarboxylase
MCANRVAPVPVGTRPELAEIESRILAERGRVSPLYQVLLHSAPIASGWERLLTAVRKQMSIPADLREMMILRVAVLNRAEFEFDAHAPIAAREGLSAAKIDALRRLEIDPLFDAREQLVLRLTDAMTRDIDVPDELMRALQQQYDARELVELVATVAAYNMVSRFLVALSVTH